MRHIITLLIFTIGFQVAAFAQKTNRPVPPPPPPPIVKREPVKTRQEIEEQNRSIYEKLWQDEKSWPLSFAHTVPGDTIILPKQIFRLQLEVGNNGIRLERSSAKDTMHIVNGKELSRSSNYVKYNFFKVKMVKDVAVLSDKETGEVLRYKLFLNTRKTKIIKLQDTKTKAFYTPAEYVGPTIMMGN